MMNDEFRTWAGLKPGDCAVYASAAMIILMAYCQSVMGDLWLGGLAVVLSVAGCSMGMRRNARVSQLTNGVRIVIYPSWLVFLAYCLWRNFAVWNAH